MHALCTSRQEDECRLHIPFGLVYTSLFPQVLNAPDVARERDLRVVVIGGGSPDELLHASGSAIAMAGCLDVARQRGHGDGREQRCEKEQTIAWEDGKKSLVLSALWSTSGSLGCMMDQHGKVERAEEQQRAVHSTRYRQ